MKFKKIVQNKLCKKIGKNQRNGPKYNNFNKNIQKYVKIK